MSEVRITMMLDEVWFTNDDEDDDDNDNDNNDDDEWWLTMLGTQMTIQVELA